MLLLLLLAFSCIFSNAYVSLNPVSLKPRSAALSRPRIVTSFVLASKAEQATKTAAPSPTRRLVFSTEVLKRANVLKRPLAVATGTLSAWLLQSNWKLASPLVAAVVVGLTSAPLSPLAAYQAPLYCGAFAGTTSIGIVKGPGTMLGLALICASMFETFERKKLFPGNANP